MTDAARPAPRWRAFLVGYTLASLAAGVLMAAVEYLGLFAEFASADTVEIGSAVFACLVYSMIAFVTGLLPVAAVALAFWWFGIGGLSAYLAASGLISVSLVLAGFGEVMHVPGALLGAVVLWACMRLAPRHRRPHQLEDLN